MAAHRTAPLALVSLLVLSVGCVDNDEPAEVFAHQLRPTAAAMPQQATPAEVAETPEGAAELRSGVEVPRSLAQEAALVEELPSRGIRAAATGPANDPFAELRDRPPVAPIAVEVMVPVNEPVDHRPLANNNTPY